MHEDTHCIELIYRAVDQGWHFKSSAIPNFKSQHGVIALHYDMGLLAQGNGLGDHVHSSHHNGDFD